MFELVEGTVKSFEVARWFGESRNQSELFAAPVSASSAMPLLRRPNNYYTTRNSNDIGLLRKMFEVNLSRSGSIVLLGGHRSYVDSQQLQPDLAGI